MFLLKHNDCPERMILEGWSGKAESGVVGTERGGEIASRPEMQNQVAIGIAELIEMSSSERFRGSRFYREV